MAQVQQVRIALGVIGVLVMGHVEEAIEVNRREDRKHAEQVGHKIVQEAMPHE